MTNDTDRFLGIELRKAREERGWVRQVVADRLAKPTSIQNIYNYERGARSMTVSRFVDLSFAVGVMPTDIAALALQRNGLGDTGDIMVDLQVMRTGAEPLEMRNWATNYLDAHRGEGIALLTRSVVQEFAIFCAWDYAEFRKHLLTFTPSSAVRRCTDGIPLQPLHPAVPGQTT